MSVVSEPRFYFFAETARRPQRAVFGAGNPAFAVLFSCSPRITTREKKEAARPMKAKPRGVNWDVWSIAGAR